MGLIKRDQIEDTGTMQLDQVDLNLTEHVEERPDTIGDKFSADSIVDQARSEAQKIIQKAKQEAEMIRQEYQEKGRGEGKAESSAKLKESLELLNSAVKERKKIIKDAENELLRLSLKIAEQIIHSEVSLHRDVCLNIVSEAIARVSDREQIIVRVNREDAEYLKRYKDRLAGMLDGVKSFSILEDNAVEPGGCVIETNLGFIDSRIATKIKSIEEAFSALHTDEPD